MVCEGYFTQVEGRFNKAAQVSRRRWGSAVELLFALGLPEDGIHA